jgi:hypothetical protein
VTLLTKEEEANTLEFKGSKTTTSALPPRALTMPGAFPAPSVANAPVPAGRSTLRLPSGAHRAAPQLRASHRGGSRNATAHVQTALGPQTGRFCRDGVGCWRGRDNGQFSSPWGPFAWFGGDFHSCSILAFPPVEIVDGNVKNRLISGHGRIAWYRRSERNLPRRLPAGPDSTSALPAAPGFQHHTPPVINYNLAHAYAHL